MRIVRAHLPAQKYTELRVLVMEYLIVLVFGIGIKKATVLLMCTKKPKVPVLVRPQVHDQGPWGLSQSEENLGWFWRPRRNTKKLPVSIVYSSPFQVPNLIQLADKLHSRLLNLTIIFLVYCRLIGYRRYSELPHLFTSQTSATLLTLPSHQKNSVPEI